MNLIKYDSLIVDPDMDTRMRLKTATTSVVQFGKVQLLNDLEDAMNSLEVGRSWDCIFLSYRFEKDTVAQFIKEAKEKKGGEDAAYILILQTNEQSSSVVAENVMIGADGFLFEPYSVDQLVEITELSARVKKERSQEREAAALSFLLKDVMHQIDLIAYLQSVGYDVGRGMRRFKQMCTVFQRLEGESLGVYYDLAVETFSEAPFPKKIYQKSYSGASKRVRERMEKKLLAELEKDLDEEEGAPAEEEGAESQP
jgi:response regulator RpfG family c-di-GMP phosphodiesterase